MNPGRWNLTGRGFLRSALMAPAGAVLTSSLTGTTAVAAEAAAESTAVPTRKLGRNGPAASMLILGGDMPGVDLPALRQACQFKTDYPEIFRRAERYFA